MAKHFNHGLKRDSKEYNQMVHMCTKYKISREEYCNNKDKYPLDKTGGKRVARNSTIPYEIYTHEYNRDAYLRSVYKITLSQYNKMFEDQKGCCAICNRHQTEFEKCLAVDHCHDTGKVRGLLCFLCNSAIGKLGDDPRLVHKAYEYLIK